MRSHDEHDPIGSSGYRELQLLSEVGVTPEITQRQLSKRVGIALGLTNAVLRNLTKKGYIRASQAGWKRSIYNLTPAGVSHKVRLTIAYIHRFLDHYQEVRQTLREEMEPLALHEESRLAIFGTGEFAELVYLGLKEIGIEEIDVFESEPSPSSRFLGIPVREVSVLQANQYDRIVVANLSGTEADYQGLLALGVPAEQLVTFFPDGKTREMGNG